MTTLEFILVPLLVIMTAIIFIILQKQKQLVGRVAELEDHARKQNQVVAKQLTVITLLKGNRCGKHIYDIGDRVLMIQHVNGLSHTVKQILIKKNQETFYMISLGSKAMWAPEHTLKSFEEPKKD